MLASSGSSGRSTQRNERLDRLLKVVGPSTNEQHRGEVGGNCAALLVPFLRDVQVDGPADSGDRLVDDAADLVGRNRLLIGSQVWQGLAVGVGVELLVGLDRGENALVPPFDLADQLVGDLPDTQDVAVAQIAQWRLSVSSDQVDGALADVDDGLFARLFAVLDECAHAFHHYGPDFDNDLAVATIESERIPALQGPF